MFSLLSFNNRQEINQSVYFVCLGLVVSTLPFQIHPNSVAVLLLSAHWLMEGNFSQKFQRLWQNKTALWLLAFFGLQVIGWAYTSNQAKVWGIFEKELSFLALPLIIASSAPLSHQKVQFLFKIFVLACLLASVSCLIANGYHTYNTGCWETFNPLNLSNESHFWGDGLTHFIENSPICFSLYIAFCQFFIVQNTSKHWQQLSNLHKSLRLLLLLYFNVFMVMLSSMGSMGGFFLVSIVFLFFYAFSKKYYLLVFSMIGIFIVLNVSLIFLIPQTKTKIESVLRQPLKATDDEKIRNSLTLRMAKWESAWEIIQKNMFFGVGTGDAEDALEAMYKQKNYQYLYQMRFNAHNQFLQTWVTFGLVGLLVFAMGIFPAMIQAFRQKDYLYVCWLLVFVLVCQIECLLEINKGIVFYALFNAIFSNRLIHKNL
ncbi:MAG: O-antigen ligase family protein [Verrucomicrobia bacterium]|nr:O-antigen ligase family protein [Cytophagales bacterium]